MSFPSVLYAKAGQSREVTTLLLVGDHKKCIHQNKSLLSWDISGTIIFKIYNTYQKPVRSLTPSLVFISNMIYLDLNFWIEKIRNINTPTKFHVKAVFAPTNTETTSSNHFVLCLYFYYFIFLCLYISIFNYLFVSSNFYPFFVYLCFLHLVYIVYLSMVQRQWRQLKFWEPGHYVCCYC